MEGRKPKASRRRDRALALRYAEDDRVPKIIASGVGEIARRILDLAQSHNIPIHEDETLTEILAKLDVGSSISPESYRLVAEVISFLYHLDKEWRDSNPHLQKIIGEPLPPSTTPATKSKE
jgi:flagellar biosynthesis protein